MEGPWATSRPNPITGRYDQPFTLDDYRLGNAPFVTVASDPSRYGQSVNLGSRTYRSPIDKQTYTLDNVPGYIHDTGSAFRGRPDKLDIAVGDFRGWNPSEAENFVAGGSGSGGGRMPTNSLMDMFQPTQQDSGNFGDRLGGMSNSLIGLGMGLLQPYNPYQGTNAWTNALQGYQSGSALDQRQAALRQQQSRDARDFAFRQEQARLAQANFNRQQARLEQSPAEQMIADIEKARGTPNEQLVRDYYAPKTEQWSLQTVGQDQWGRDIKKWVNSRTQEVRDVNLGPPPGTAFAGTGAGGVPYFSSRGPLGAGTNAPAATGAVPNLAAPFSAGGDPNAPPQVTLPDGRVVAIPPGMDAKTFRQHATAAGADVATGKFTEAQAKTQLFAGRMEQAQSILDKLDEQGTSYRGGGIERLPGSDKFGYGNVLQTPEYRQYRGARDAFINALLRNESGAAINTGEYTRIEREMFPQPGDDAKTIANKRALRAAATTSMKRAAGPGYQGPAETPAATGGGGGGSPGGGGGGADRLRQELIRRGINPDQ